MSHKVVVFVSIMILILPNVYAQQATNPQSNYYQESGFRLISDPVICMNTPSDSKYPSLSLKANEFLTSSVSEWSSLLNSGGTSRIPIWKIQLASTATSDICNITIDFLPKPSTEDHSDNMEPLGKTTYDFDNHKAQIQIYYDKIVFESYACVPTTLANGSRECIPVSFDSASGSGPIFYEIRYTPHYADELAPDYQLQWAVRHEFGHAFGLDHYIISDEENQKLVSGFIDAPSIMVPAIPVEGVYKFNISTMDIEHLKSLYDYKGFGGQASEQVTPSTPTITSPEMTSSEISYWTPLLRSYFGNSTNNLNSDNYPAAVLGLVDLFDSEHLVSIPDPVGTQTGVTFSMYMPPWFANVLQWWATSEISDNDLALSMQYLYNNHLFYFSQ